MCVQIEQFAHSEEGNASIRNERVRLAGGWCPRCIRPVSQVDPREDPVVCAILEDVARRHRGGRKAVHEQRFILALQEVQNTHDQRKLLELRGGLRGAVDQRAAVVHERVNEKGAEVFHHENCPPGNLRAYSWR